MNEKYMKSTTTAVIFDLYKTVADNTSKYFLEM